MRIETGYRVESRPELELVRRSCASEAPLLPGASRDALPVRLREGHVWTPPGTMPLVRLRAEDGRRAVSNTRAPEPGWAVEFDLGVVHRFHVRGARRLLETADGFRLGDGEEDPPQGEHSLGWVGERPLSMLVPLYAAQLPTGDITVVAGDVDPLLATARIVGELGHIDGFPIAPRRVPRVTADAGLFRLVRRADEDAWRHRYAATGADRPIPAGEVSLGGLLSEPRHGHHGLWLTAAGTLVAEPAAPEARAVPSMRDRVRWAGAPLGWSGGRPRAWAARAAAQRGARILRPGDDALANPGLLGHMRSEARHGWSPLYAAYHPVLPDQFVSRCMHEAGDLGYRETQLLGYTLDRLASPADEQPDEVRWGSRFGRGRRLA